MYVPLDKVSDFIHEYFQNVKVSGNGTLFNAKCALCGDSKTNPRRRRFYLNYKNGSPLWFCHNCGRSGNFLSLYCELKALSLKEAMREIYEFNKDNIASILSPKSENISPTVNTIPTHDYILDESIDSETVPDGIIQTQAQKMLRQFRKDRHVPINVIMYIAYRGLYRNRVIIPIIKNNHIIYFQARSLTDQMPKYMNPEAEKEQIILNEENFDKGKYIIVTEGILDAYSIGDQGTTMFGAHLNQEFIKKLQSYTDKGLIVCFDNDERGKEELHKIIKEKYAHPLNFFTMPYKYKEIKDINALSVSKNVNNIYAFILDNSYGCFETIVKLQMEAHVK